MDPAVSFAQANQFSCLKQLWLYFTEALFDGGQARKESIMDQVLATRYVSSTHPKIHFKRIDREISKRENKLDAIGYMEHFKHYGLELCEKLDSIDLEILQK